jgi:hypothetical protein
MGNGMLLARKGKKKEWNECVREGGRERERSVVLSSSFEL